MLQVLIDEILMKWNRLYEWNRKSKHKFNPQLYQIKQTNNEYQALSNEGNYSIVEQTSIKCECPPKPSQAKPSQCNATPLACSIPLRTPLHNVSSNSTRASSLLNAYGLLDFASQGQKDTTGNGRAGLVRNCGEINAVKFSNFL